MIRTSARLSDDTLVSQEFFSMLIDRGKWFVNFVFALSLGSFGSYIGAMVSAILLTGCLIVYFIIMAQLFYPMTLALYAWSTGNDPVYLVEPTLG